MFVTVFFATYFVVNFVGKRLKRQMNFIYSVLEQFVERQKSAQQYKTNGDFFHAESIKSLKIFIPLILFAHENESTKRKSDIGQTRAGLERIAQKLNDYDLEILA